MKWLRWTGFAILLSNAALAGFIAWQRLSLAGSLDASTQGTVFVAQHVSGRGGHHTIVARYTVGGETRSVSGSDSDDTSLNVQQHPQGSTINVYFSTADPRRASLTPSAGAGVYMVLAPCLLGASIAFAWFLL